MSPLSLILCPFVSAEVRAREGEEKRCNTRGGVAAIVTPPTCYSMIFPGNERVAAFFLGLRPFDRFGWWPAGR
jgi:hypothetical protein